MWTAVLVILGLVVFEIINSVDNAIINAHTLKEMPEKSRKYFWWIVVPFAVFLIRGVLPFCIVWLTTPEMTIAGALSATLGNDMSAQQAIEENSYILLSAGGMFLILLYLHWLFLEEKAPYFVPEKLIRPSFGIWFFALSALMLVGVMYMSREKPLMMLASATGNAVFFILYGFRETAEKKEKELAHSSGSDLSKLFFLAILDASFSIDGILGAFAFTTNILLIFIGNGIGAVVVAWMTLCGVERVGKYKWIKNGALTSIGFLGLVMMLEAFEVRVPQWLPPVVTFGLVGITFWSSHKYLQKN